MHAPAPGPPQILLRWVPVCADAWYEPEGCGAWPTVNSVADFRLCMLTGRTGVTKHSY